MLIQYRLCCLHLFVNTSRKYWPAQDTQRRHPLTTNCFYHWVTNLPSGQEASRNSFSTCWQNWIICEEFIRVCSTSERDRHTKRRNDGQHESASWWRSAGHLHTLDPGQNPGRTNHHPSTTLTELCLHSTYLMFEDTFFDQAEGAIMGLPLSPIVANLFMEAFEEKALGSAVLRPRMWVRYVDDTFVLWPHKEDELETNSIDTLIHNTHQSSSQWRRRVKWSLISQITRKEGKLSIGCI